MVAIETQTGISRVSRFGVAAWLLILAAVGIVTGAAFYFDAAVQGWVAVHRTSGWLAFMEEVSRWGDWPAHVVLGLLLILLAYANRKPQWVRIFAAMLVACALAGIAARVVKITTGRARPSVATDTSWNGPRLAANYNAFPSGHTASSTAFFAVLAFVSWRRGAAFLLIPALVGFSRIYVSAHHLSDVTCAALLGAGSAWLVVRLALTRTHAGQSELRVI